MNSDVDVFALARVVTPFAVVVVLALVLFDLPELSVDLVEGYVRLVILGMLTVAAIAWGWSWFGSMS